MVGCYFYWSQVVWRKLVDLGLGTAYRKKFWETKICRRLFFLPFLPPHKNVRIYNKLKQSAVVKVKDLCQYIFRTWISSLTAKWPPKTWSVFIWVVRTNNDAEGWHNSLDPKIRKEDLYYESRLLPLHVTLVCKNFSLVWKSAFDCDRRTA
jgi:hypothetical protein